MMVEGVRPYIMDLGSVNGTFVNNERIEGMRYYELLEQVTQSRWRNRGKPHCSFACWCGTYVRGGPSWCHSGVLISSEACVQQQMGECF
jgi:FHA domain